MTAISGLAQQLNLTASRDAASNMLVLSGERGTVVFNPHLRGVVIGDKVCFRGHRVIITQDQVSVPPGFVAECERQLRPAGPRPAPEARPPASVAWGRFHVVIDAGHGGRDPGAIGVSGRYEKAVNLATAQLVAAKLRARGVRVTMTRSDDRFIELNDRAATGNRARADAFVSIHADSSESRSAFGYAAYVVHTKNGYSDSDRAGKIARECGLDFYACKSTLARNRAGNMRLASAVRTHMRGATSSPDRGTRLGALRVLERSLCPAVLIELGFLSNPMEESRLFQPDYQDRLASAISDGIAAFLSGG